VAEAIIGMMQLVGSGTARAVCFGPSPVGRTVSDSQDDR
jgi:hypothetical protein